jgi:hypothetical protein
MKWFGSRFARFTLAFTGSMALTGAVLVADGSVWFQATSTLRNPCNNELIRGPLDAHLMVQASSGPSGDHVVVHRNFNATLTGDQGNTYEASSIGHAQFDALASSYVLTFENNVKGHGPAPDFTVLGRLRVFVDTDQNPIGYSAMVISATCKKP